MRTRTSLADLALDRVAFTGYKAKMPFEFTGQIEKIIEPWTGLIDPFGGQIP